MKAILQHLVIVREHPFPDLFLVLKKYLKNDFIYRFVGNQGKQIQPYFLSGITFVWAYNFCMNLMELKITEYTWFVLLKAQKNQNCVITIIFNIASKTKNQQKTKQMLKLLKTGKI